MNRVTVRMWGLLGWLCLAQAGAATAQEVLTLKAAVETALQQNFGIRIARAQEVVRENEVQLGRSALYPVVAAQGARTGFKGDILQQRIGVPEPQQFNNAGTTNLNGSVGLNWTLFEGLGMFAALARLEALRKAGEFATRLEIDNTVAAVMSTYYALLQQQQQLAVLRNGIAISELRYNIAQARHEVGLGTKVEMLAAQVDLNADKAAVLRQEQQVHATKVDLNLLLNRQPGQEITLRDTILVNPQLALEGLRQDMVQQGPALGIARANLDASRLSTRVIRSDAYPSLAANASYGYNKNTSDFGFAALSRNIGFNYGISASVPLFSGFAQRRRLENARLQENIAELSLQDQQQALDAQLEQAYQIYRNRISLLTLEQDNQQFARQNVAIALERYRLGLMVPVELREAQLNLVQAQSRLIQAAFEAKAGEIELMRLSGTITRVVQ